MNGHYAVSVVIPTFNCEQYIKETLDSIISQTCSDIEIIIVDDGSTDRTIEIATAHAPFAKIICQPNSGVCVSRNHGLRLATGDFICFLDHDDYWLPHKIETQLRVFSSHPEFGIVFGDFIVWSPNSEGIFPKPSTYSPKSIELDLDDNLTGWIYHMFLLDCWMLTSSAMFRKSVFAECGNFDETLPYSEDWDLWLRLSRRYQFAKLRQANTLYRQHPDQGNRQPRPIDYRTRLLRESVNRWGLSSPDGRSISRSAFRSQLSHYHKLFALHQLQYDQQANAIASFATAWKTSPFHVQNLAYIALAIMGWRP
jgi:glycosyltransferase involved in cell wall biosynthesis